MLNDKSRSVIWTVAGGYLLYLGDDLITQCFRKETEYPVISILSGALFAVIGGILLFMAWKKWHKQEKEGYDEK